MLNLLHAPATRINCREGVGMGDTEMTEDDPVESVVAPVRDYRIAAVDRALDVIEALARIGPAPLARIAEQAGATRTAAFRVLRTLQARDFAVQEGHGVWRIGLRWALAAAPGLDLETLAVTARPHLARLGGTFGENALLRVRRQTEAATIARFQAPAGLSARVEPDQGGPLHAGSGRLLLAYAPDEVRKAVLARRLQRFTPATRTEAAWVTADLPRIRERGWLIAADEVAEATTVLAAPVRDARDQVVAAMVVIAPALRLRAPAARARVPELVEAAQALSRALGAP
jgi:DNA-binding IclR family transcriptional regulator